MAEAAQPKPSLEDSTTSFSLAIILNGLALLHTFACAGIVFGWAALESILLDEGVFGGDDQTRLLNLTFMAGAIGNYLGNLPFGALLDRFGPKISGCLASACFASGLYLCANAATLPALLDQPVYSYSEQP